MMMNFVEQEQEQQQEREREYGDKEEELQELGDEEEEEEEDETMMMTTTTSKLPFPSPTSSSSSSCPNKYRNFLPQHENLWVGSSENSQQDYKNQEAAAAALNFDNKQVELMELSLDGTSGKTSSTSGGGGGGQECMEREHMFDKVVTPSDVGKLNRLVIPKQHAEKYFPLDSSSNEKGLLLNFEDRNGKPWRFRYSYWNSSQSYVMTKGWSRFVKEKKLDAGDIVSFQRGVGESGKHHLYIDWRRRANAPDPTSFTHFELQNQLHFPQSSVRWGRLYSLPQPLSSIPRPYQQPHHHHHHQFQHLNYTIHQPYHHHPQYYLRPSPAGSLQIGAVHHHHQQQQQQEGGDHQLEAAPMVIDSIPVVHGRSVGKRLRLFGVNMECAIQDDFSSSSSLSSSSSSSIYIPHGSSTMVGSLFSPHLPAASASTPASSLPLPSDGASISIPTSTTHQAYEFSKKGKTSLSFDLDL